MWISRINREDGTSFEQKSKDPTIISNWSTFSTMATMYIKMELFKKAQECLKKVDGRILGRDRVPFHYLLSLYGSVGNKDEVLPRVE